VQRRFRRETRRALALLVNPPPFSILELQLILMYAAPVAPDGFIVHTESTTSILFATPTGTSSAPTGPDMSNSAPVFLNPVQEYNRDLSVVAIRTWSEIWSREKTKKWEAGVLKKRENKKRGPGGEQKGRGKKQKGEDGKAVAPAAEEEAKVAETEQAAPVEAEKVRFFWCPSPPFTSHALSSQAPAAAVEQPESAASELFIPRPPTYKFSLLEALSATGLRAIRYAKELPLLKYVHPTLRYLSISDWAFSSQICRSKRPLRLRRPRHQAQHRLQRSRPGRCLDAAWCGGNQGRGRGEADEQME
jgi:hypothetical protein